MASAHKTPLIVMDTNVLVAGACRRPGSLACRLLHGVLEGQIPLILTPSIALEYQDVLLRPGVLALTKLTHAQSVDLVADLIALSYQVQLDFVWRPNLSDEADNKFVDAAVHGSAIILTYNVDHYRAPDIKQYGWAVMTPREFLTRYPIEEAH